MILIRGESVHYFLQRDDKSMKGGVRISLVDDCKEKYVTSEF